MHSIFPVWLLVLVSAAGLCAQENIIPQVADGQGWSSVLVVTNTTAASAQASLTFFKDTYGGLTEPWNLAFIEGLNPSALNVPAGSSLFLHTPGAAAALSQGWAQLTAGPGVSAYVIYTYTQAGAPKQDATAPALASATRFLVPFDNTGELVTTAAVVNPSPSQLAFFSNFKTSTGTSMGGTLIIPANGHLTFVFPQLFTDTVGKEGLAEFYSDLGPFAMIVLRAHSGLPISFTTVPVLPGSGPPILSPPAGGGGGGVPSGDITYAGFSIGKQTTSQGTTETVGGLIGAYKPAAWNLPFNGAKIDKCIIYDITYDLTATYPSAPEFLLDAGKLTLTGPGIATGSITVTETRTTTGPGYSLRLPPGTLQAGKTYNLAAAGGTGVGAFNISATLPDNFSSNVSSVTSINRSNPLAISWTGGGFENVIINVVGTSISPPNVHTVTVTCVVPASLAAYSIPTAALATVPAVTSGGQSYGTLTITTAPQFSGTVSAAGATTTTLTPNLVGGGKVKYGAFAPYFTIISTLTSIQ